ncbi:hypothetical protein LBMAG42_24120 [Deltaproteobacteria bacterium]|nr:hypothetical protein LBMAG42_24120 [Deltaproteobacteria bacterium]
MFISSTLLALVLATPDAEAMNIFVAKLSFNTQSESFIRVVDSDLAGEAASMELDITSDSGSESVDLTESDAWLHGAATLKALSTTDTEATLTLYDEKGAAQVSFSGTMTSEGVVTLTADATKGSSVCESKLGCVEITETLDIELLAAEVFVNPLGGYDVTFDLAGGDVYGLTKADFTLKNFGAAQADAGRVVTSEVTFGEIGAVWEGELSLDHAGEIEIDATSYDVDGKKLEKSTTTLGHILHTVADSFAPAHTVRGSSMLSAGDAGSVAWTKMKDKLAAGDMMTVITENWTTTTAPTHATVELDGGETLTIPANSFQRAGFYTIELEAIVITHLKIAINGGNLTLNGSSTLSILDLAAPVCINGTCVAISTNEKGTLDLAVTGYASTAAGVASSAKIGVMAYDKNGGKVGLVDTKVSFDAAVAVVFANEVAFAEDPLGLDLGGEVSLLGAKDSKGKQKTVAKGDFYGSFVRTGEGDLSLGGVDKNDIEAKGDILIGGEPIDFELTDTNKDGVIEAPPVILMMTTGNGKGTRDACTANNGKPGLL